MTCVHTKAILDLNMRDPHVWVFGNGSKHLEVRVNGRLRFGNPYINAAAARASFGIARVPGFCCREHSEKWRGGQSAEKYEPAAPVTLYVVYPHARHLASKVRVFVDFLVERYSGTRTRDH